MTKEQLIDGINWGYSGSDKMYRVYMPGAGEVYCTESSTDRDMFIAKLKAQIMLMGDSQQTP